MTSSIDTIITQNSALVLRQNAATYVWIDHWLLEDTTEYLGGDLTKVHVVLISIGRLLHFFVGGGNGWKAQVAKLPQDRSRAAIAHVSVHLAIHHTRRIQITLDSTKYTFVARKAVELKMSILIIIPCRVCNPNDCKASRSTAFLVLRVLGQIPNWDSPRTLFFLHFFFSGPRATSGCKVDEIDDSVLCSALEINNSLLLS